MLTPHLEAVLIDVLIDVLDRRSNLAGSLLKNRKKFPDKASLYDLLYIAGHKELLGDEKRFLTDTAIGLCNIVKDHRDLIHPHKELRSKFQIDSDTAKSMIHLLRLVIRDLADSHIRGLLKLYEEK